MQVSTAPSVARRPVFSAPGGSPASVYFDATAPGNTGPIREKINQHRVSPRGERLGPIRRRNAAGVHRPAPGISRRSIS